MHLSKYMADHDLTDDAVALEIKRTRATVSRIRRKMLRPDWETIKKIREFTKGLVTADDFEDVEPPKKSPVDGGVAA